jgi:hypothetical protein
VTISDARSAESEVLPSTTRPVEPGEFQKYFLQRFSPIHALRILADERPTFPGYRGAALNALACWMLAPRDGKLREAAISNSAARYLGQIERPLVENTGGSKELAQLHAFHMLATDFLREVYFPIGGVVGILAASDRTSIRKALNEARKSLDCAIEMVRVLHWLQEQGPQVDLYPASIKKTTEAIDGLGLVRARAAYDHWREHKDNVSLTYAAESIEVGHRSLLDCLQSGALDKATPTRIRIMIGRAHFVNQAILSTVKADDVLEGNEACLPKMPAIAFNVDPFEGKEITTIRNEFKRKLRSSGSN